MAASYQTFGQQKPIVVDPLGVVLAGNHQLRAARQLRWTHIAAVTFTGSPTEAKAFALADNRTQELGSTDDAALLALLNEVSATDPDLTAAAGYSDADLADLAELAVSSADVPGDRLEPTPPKQPPAPVPAPVPDPGPGGAVDGTPILLVVSNATARRWSAWWGTLPGTSDEAKMNSLLDDLEA